MGGERPLPTGLFFSRSADGFHATRYWWRARRTARAQKAVSDIEASIVSLNDDDLLDLHDIFLPNPSSALAIFAAKEVHRRTLSPDKPA